MERRGLEKLSFELLEAQINGEFVVLVFDVRGDAGVRLGQKHFGLFFPFGFETCLQNGVIILHSDTQNIELMHRTNRWLLNIHIHHRNQSLK